MAFRRLRSALFLTLLLFLLFSGSILLIHSLIHRPAVQDYLLEQISESIGVEIHADQIRFLFWKGIGIRARDLTIKTAEGTKPMAASGVRITLSPAALIKGKIVPTELALDNPQIELDLPGGPGLWPPDRNFLPKGIPTKALSAFPSVVVDRARIVLKGTSAEARAVSIHLSRRPGDPLTFDGALNGTIAYKEDAFPISAKGHVAMAPGSEPSIHLDLKASDIPLSHIQLPDLPVETGAADMTLTASGSLETGIRATGRLVMNHPAFAIIDDGDIKSFAFDRLLLPFDAVLSESGLSVPSFQVAGPGFTLNANAKLDLKDRDDPHLSVTVQTDPMAVETFRRIFPSSLVPQWVDATLFPVFSGGRVRVDRFSLQGGLRQIGDLDLPENAGCLMLQLTCTDLTAFRDAGVIPVKGVSGRLKIEGGGVHASHITGRFGDSHIQEGSLRVDSLYQEDPLIRVTAAGSARIQDLLQQKDIPLIPDEVRGHVAGFSSATGRIDGEIEVGYEEGWAYPKMVKGRLGFADCAVASSAGLIFPVFVKAGTLTVDGPERRFAVNGRWGRTAVEAAGRIGGSWETGTARITAQADLIELIGHFHPDLQATLVFKKPVPCRLALTKREKDWLFSGDLDLKDISLETESMTVAPFAARGGRLDFSGEIVPGETFSVSRLTCTLGESAFDLAGVYDLGEAGTFDVRASSRKLRLEDMGVRFKKGNLMGKGTLAFDTAIEGSRSEPTMTIVTGEAEGSDLSFATSEFPHPVEQCDLSMTFKGKDLLINSLDLRLGNTPFHIKGRLVGWDGMRGDVTIRSDFLDLSDLISPGLIAYFRKEPMQHRESEGPDHTEDPHSWRDRAGHLLERSDIHLELTAEDGQWEGLPWGPLTFRGALRSGDLYIRRCSASWAHGQLLLRGHVLRGPSPDILLSGYMDMSRQPLEELPSSLDFISSRGEGLLTMEALLFAKGADKRGLAASLTGSVNILLEEGVVKKSNVFIKILDSLSLQRVVEKRPPHLSKEGIYFERIAARFDLEKGVAKSEDVVMRSRVFNAAAAGEADLTTGTVKGEVGIQPLGTLDSILSSVPVAGYLLTGDQKALYVEYFKVDGPLSDPEVTHIPLKSVGNGTFGFLSRLFMTPKRIYDTMADAARDFEGDGYPIPDAHRRPENDMGGMPEGED